MEPAGRGDLLHDGARGVDLGDRAEAVRGDLAAEDGGLEGGAGAGAGLALDDLDGAGGAAEVGPVGDLAEEDALELLGGDVVNVDVGVHDRAHAHDADLVVDEALELVGLELLLGEDVGAADLDGALGDLGEALAGAAAGDGDGDVGVGVLEGVTGLLDERLEGGGA